MKALREPLTAMVLAGGFYLAHGRFGWPLAELVVMGILFRRLLSSIGDAQEQLQAAVNVEASDRAVHRLIEEAEEQREELRGGGREPTLNHSIQLADVSFSYGDKLVLDRFSMVARAGQLTVLSGASGAGKTTITDLILGLHDPQSGEVLLDGVPLSEVDLNRWRATVGYVPQELGLFHDSVLANVTLGDPTIGELAVTKALKLAGAWDFVAGTARAPGNQRRRARCAAVGRPAPADSTGTGPGAGAQAADPRRGQQRARPRDRGRDLCQCPPRSPASGRSSPSPTGRSGSTSPTASTMWVSRKQPDVADLPALDVAIYVENLDGGGCRRCGCKIARELVARGRRVSLAGGRG